MSKGGFAIDLNRNQKAMGKLVSFLEFQRDNFMTVDEACVLAGIPKVTLYRSLRHKKISNMNLKKIEYFLKKAEKFLSKPYGSDVQGSRRR